MSAIVALPILTVGSILLLWAMLHLQEGEMANTKKSGSFEGKSNKLGHGGRAAQLKAQGVPRGVIGAIARKKGAAPGEKNYHGAKKK